MLLSESVSSETIGGWFLYSLNTLMCCDRLVAAAKYYMSAPQATEALIEMIEITLHLPPSRASLSSVTKLSPTTGRSLGTRRLHRGALVPTGSRLMGVPDSSSILKSFLITCRRNGGGV